MIEKIRSPFRWWIRTHSYTTANNNRILRVYVKIQTFWKKFSLINGNLKNSEKIVALIRNYKASYKQINIIKIDNDTNCLEGEITLNKNKKYKYYHQWVLVIVFPPVFFYDQLFFFIYFWPQHTKVLHRSAVATPWTTRPDPE